MLPFTHDAFVEVFRLYNQAIWPAQIVAYMLACLTLLAVARRHRQKDRLALAVLAAMWMWTGLLYHGFFFSAINGVAVAFAIGFVLQGALFAALAFGRRLPGFAITRSGTGLTGLAFIGYALVLYPPVGALAGQTYPGVPVFGVAPCPVVIFTFGLLLLAERRVPLWLLPVPGARSLIGGSAAFLLEVPQDWPLLVSGAIAIPLVLRKNRRRGAGLPAPETADAVTAGGRGAAGAARPSGAMRRRGSP